jgi:hypothetical protein
MSRYLVPAGLAGNFKQASMALFTSACRTSSANPNKPVMTEFNFRPDSSKEGVPLVIKISQGERMIGVFEEIYAIVVSFSIASS